MSQRRNALTAPAAPQQDSGAGEALRADVKLLHRQLRAGSFMLNGQDLDISLPASGSIVVQHRLGKAPTGAALVLVPTPNPPAFNIVAWDASSITIASTAEAKIRLRIE